jgi:rhomboid family GlyGly-CTERM serine protease
MLTHNEVWKRYLRAYNPALLLLLLSAVAQALQATEYLQYERPAVLAGQIWRLWTAHIVHLGWGHYLLNAAGLLLVWLLFRQATSVRAWCWHFMFAGFAISLGLLCFNPALVWYVGLSGILHAMFIVGLLADMRRDAALSALVLLGFAAKIIFEQIYGPLPGSARSAGGPVVVDAHLYGAIAGCMSYGIQYGFQRIKIYHRGTEDTEIKKLKK